MFKNYSKNQWLLLLTYCTVNLVSSFLISIHAPFYPKVAADKGATASQFGFAYGAYYLTIFFTGPLYGKLIPLFGAAFVCSAGTLIMAVTSILFGLLDYLYEADIFIGLSVAIRVAEGIGSTAFRTASLSIISNEFSDNIESAFSLYQSAFNLGLIMGPAIGGVLFELGGFILPFSVEGVLLLCCAAAIICMQKHCYQEDYTELKTDATYYDLIKLPFVFMGVLVIFGAYFCVGVILISLEPHVQSLELSSSIIGLLFVLNGLSVALSTPFWGKVCESFISPHNVWSVGVILNVLSLLLYGPAPYFSLELNIYTITVSLTMNGIAEGAQTVAGYCGITKEVANTGVQLNLGTKCLISTIYTSTLALGLFIGPTLGGFLYDVIGIPWGIHVFIFYQMMLGVATVILVHVKKKKEKYDEEYEKIQGSSLVSSNSSLH